MIGVTTVMMIRLLYQLHNFHCLVFHPVEVILKQDKENNRAYAWRCPKCERIF